MSFNDNKIKMCQAHLLEILAVDLNAAKEQKQKYLCAKCLIERIDGNYIVLLKEAINMIKEMKTKCKEDAVKKTQDALTNMQNLQSSVSKINEQFSIVFEKLQNKIKENINLNEQEIELKKNLTDELILDKDIETLSFVKNGSGSSNFDPPKQKYNLDNFVQLLDKIQNDLLQTSNKQQFSEIFEQIQQLKSLFQLGQPTLKRKFNKHETPTLKQLCNQHGKKIMMMNLNQDQLEQSGLACEKCIQQFPKREYITIEDANIKWKEFQGQQKQMISKYNNDRQFKFSSVIKLIQQLKDIYDHTLSDLIQQLERQKIMNYENQNYNLNYVEDIYEKDEQEILKIVDILSQKDKHQRLKKEQQEQDQVDLIFYQNLKQNLENLMKYDLMTKYNLLRIQNMDQGQLSNYIEINQYNESQNNSDFKSIIKKFQQLDQFLSIIEDANTFYIKLQQEIDDLKQKQQLSQLFNSDSSHILQQQYEVFKENSKKMNLLIKADENQNLLTKLEQEFNQNKQSFLDFQKQSNDNNKRIETLNTQIEQLNQEISKLQQNKSQLDQSNQSLNNQIHQLNQQITKNQKEASQQLNKKDQEIIKLEQQQNLLSQEFNQFKQNLRDQPKLLNQEFYIEVCKQIEEKSNIKIVCSFLIYLGTRDGLNNSKCWGKINGKSNLLIIFKSKSGNIFGGYSPCQWLEKQNGYVQDQTLSSFLFSQTHNQFYQLKEANKAHAIYRHQSYGPSFGNGYDIYIGSDFTSGSSSLGTAYQIDKYEIQDTTIHLFGQSTPNLEECEILELILK
ncbi:unnamed protein product [Paramecium sonneborni]|uniref:TLDc domain-containing protein n=1 Tax=Paramecium sonneborni TaxID=65129 RepID=A0A8S1RKW1_9CILI|nr:unnamed protein product [Paramecium sonneborni]